MPFVVTLLLVCGVGLVLTGTYAVKVGIPVVDTLTYLDVGRNLVNAGSERRDRHRVQSPDHVLTGQDEHRAAAVRARKGKLSDLAARYFGHTCAPKIGPNSLRRTGRRAYASCS